MGTFRGTYGEHGTVWTDPSFPAHGRPTGRRPSERRNRVSERTRWTRWWCKCSRLLANPCLHRRSLCSSSTRLCSSPRRAARCYIATNLSRAFWPCQRFFPRFVCLLRKIGLQLQCLGWGALVGLHHSPGFCFVSPVILSPCLLPHCRQFCPALFASFPRFLVLWGKGGKVCWIASFCCDVLFRGSRCAISALLVCGILC